MCAAVVCVCGGGGGAGGAVGSTNTMMRDFGSPHCVSGGGVCACGRACVGVCECVGADEGENVYT